MAIFWRIEYSYDLNVTKNPGYQILDDNKSTIKLTDEDGNELTGGYDYSFVEETTTAPPWWVE